MESQREKELNQVMKWVSDRLRYNDVPRVSDAYEYSKTMQFNLSKMTIANKMRGHPHYHMNMPQQRQASRSQKYRPIQVNSLGHLHADIGKFSVVSEYETPISFRAGYLVAIDVLSRFVYVVILKKSKSADAILRALQQLMEHHKEHHPDYSIKSISFDKEPGIMSSKIQDFLKRNNISFHAFQLSSSKAKMAEATIRRIRTAYARLYQMDKSNRWWRLMPDMVRQFNTQTIVIDGKRTDFRPVDINTGNVEQFVLQLQKKAPAYYYSQYQISPRFVDFKYVIGMYVRPKRISTSSAVLGQKHSEKTLEDDLFRIEELIPFVTRAMTIYKAYRCTHTLKGYSEIFEEDVIVPSEPYKSTEKN